MRFDEKWLAEYQARAKAAKLKDAAIAQRIEAKVAPKRSKYGAQPVVIDGIRFASTGEGNRYKELRLLEAGGRIADLKCQPKFPIVINSTKVCDVLGDFSYLEEGQSVVEDFKGHDNPLSVLKRKLVTSFYKDVTWRVVRA